jgi:hypothetical protein
MTPTPSPGRGRTDPYHLVFGARSLDDTLFPPIAGEAKARDAPLDDPERFLFLTSVGRLLQAIAGDPAEGGPGSGEALRQHGRLLYHAFHFWREGKKVLELEEAEVRRVLDKDHAPGDASAGSILATPAPAGYARLPRNLIWAAADQGLQPEPADGFFWVHRRPEGEPAEIFVLAPLGVRHDRPGFTVVTAEGVAQDGRGWAHVQGRPGGVDFATTLPGGELDRLYSIETPTELLKLASLCFLARPGG